MKKSTALDLQLRDKNVEIKHIIGNIPVDVKETTGKYTDPTGQSPRAQIDKLQEL